MCAGATLHILRVLPDRASDQLISVRGANSAGNVRDYQIWYRNAAAFCTPSTFNLSNAVEITWGA